LITHTLEASKALPATTNPPEPATISPPSDVTAIVAAGDNVTVFDGDISAYVRDHVVVIIRGAFGACAGETTVKGRSTTRTIKKSLVRLNAASTRCNR